MLAARHRVPINEVYVELESLAIPISSSLSANAPRRLARSFSTGTRWIRLRSGLMTTSSLHANHPRFLTKESLGSSSKVHMTGVRPMVIFIIGGPFGPGFLGLNVISAFTPKPSTNRSGRHYRARGVLHLMDAATGFLESMAVAWDLKSTNHLTPASFPLTAACAKTILEY